MIVRYEEKQKKYKRLIQYTKEHPNISEELRKDILYILEKHRLCFCWIEEEEVIELVEKCIKEGSSRVLKKEFHSLLFGDSDTLVENNCLYNNDREEDSRDDDFYNNLD